MASSIDPAQPPSGSATTAGVRANMLAAKSEIEALQAGYALDVIHPAPGSSTGYIYSGAHLISSYPGSLVAVPNRHYFAPFRLDFKKNINAIAAIIETIAAASKFRLGIYSVLASGLPGSLLAETGDLDSTTTGLKTGSITPLQLLPGWYYLSLLHNEGAAFTNLDSYQMPATPLGFSSTTKHNNIFAHADIAAGWTSMPASAAAITMSPESPYSPPLIFLGLAP